MAKDKDWSDPASYEATKSNDNQDARIQAIRAAARMFAEAVDKAVPAGPDKTFIFRSFRTVVMWANYTISRNTDDAREDDKDGGKEAT